MIENINDLIRKRVIRSYIQIKNKKMDFWEDFLLPLQEKNEPLYDAMIMIMASDAYEFLKWMELNQNLSDTTMSLIEALEEVENLPMLKVMMEENTDKVFGLLLCFLEKNKLEKTKIVEIFNYTMRYQYKQIQRINYFFNYELVYAILKGYFVKPNFNKRDFINLYQYYEEIDETTSIQVAYASFVQSIRKYDPRLYERATIEIIEDFYVYTKWMCSNKQYQDIGIFDLKLLDYIETHDFEDSIQYIWNNKHSLRNVIDDFIFYNTAKNKVEKEDIIGDVQEPESQIVLSKIRELKNRMS